MTWEVADTRHPERPGPRYPALADAARVIESARPRDRFYLRWLGEDRPPDDEEVPIGR